jgi:predicted NBD/HSP70 family sugar kinase
MVHTKVAVDTQIMRGINISAVVSVLRANSRSMSVSELAEQTGLSRQAVSRSLNSLASAGLVMFVSPDSTVSRTGRPAQLVRFRTEAGHVIAVSASPREIVIALADLGGEVLAQRSAVPTGSGNVIDSLLRAILDLLSERSLQPSDIWAACVAAPGIIDPDEGLVKFLPSMSELHGDLLARTLADELGCAVIVDNDLKLAVEGELWKGTLHDVSSLVLIEWGERVGAGLLLNGSLYRGASNDAGDIGFLDLLAESPIDGTRHGDGWPELGPFESWVGGAELIAQATENAVRSGDDTFIDAVDGRRDHEALQIVLSAVQANNPSAIEAVVTIAERFAVGIAAIRALLDPQLIIIGGPMARAGDSLLNALHAALATQVLNQPALEISSLGDDAVVLGAIRRALDEVDRAYFSSTTVTDTVISGTNPRHPTKT